METVNFNAREIAVAVDGRWNCDLPDDFVFSTVKTDTREDCSGAMFLALRGERFDAHDFLDKAAATGAAALCIEAFYEKRIAQEWDIPVLLVDDTLRAYQKIANFHKNRLKNLTSVAITGSMGKTSCKEIVRSILEAAVGENAVYATRSNTNNQVGVPQNLLRVSPEHRYCVIEMGTNHFGEIEPLSRTLEPDVALISSIAPCHLENLGDLHGVAVEKSKIFSALKQEGTAVIPVDCPEVDYLLAQTKSFKTLRFGKDVKVVYHGGNLQGSTIELQFCLSGKTISLDWPLSGIHQAQNASAAATVALSLGIDEETIAQGLKNCVLPGMRMKVKNINRVNWINDAYNASPQSVKAALRWLHEFTDPSKLILVLGDMLELGESSVKEHEGVLNLAFELFPTAEFILVGDEYRKAGTKISNYKNCQFCTNSSVAENLLAPLIKSGYTILLKGSRGMKLERLWPDEDCK